MELANCTELKDGALPLDWRVQHGKEELCTQAVHQELERAFGPDARVSVLRSAHAQKRGDFKVELANGVSFHIELKVEDYKDTLFPEVVQLVRTAPTGALSGERASTAGHLEPGWVYKSTAEFMLYVSSETGRALLVARRRILELQLRMLQSLLIESSEFDEPVRLQMALNPCPRNGVSRAGIGLGLLTQLLVDEYLGLYGSRTAFSLDFSQSLLALKARLCRPGTPVSPAMTYWRDKVLMNKEGKSSLHCPTIECSSVEGAPLFTDWGWAKASLSTQAIETGWGYQFFERCAALSTCSGQQTLVPHVAGSYLTHRSKTRGDVESLPVNMPLNSLHRRARLGSVSSIHALQRHLSQESLLFPPAPPAASAHERRLRYLRRLLGAQ